MTQEVRNRIYAVVGGVLSILIILGVVDIAQQDVVLDVTDRVLNLVGLVLALGGDVMAWVKSNPSTTTVIDVPKHEVEVVITEAGRPNVDADSRPVTG